MSQTKLNLSEEAKLKQRTRTSVMVGNETKKIVEEVLTYLIAKRGFKDKSGKLTREYAVRTACKFFLKHHKVKISEIQPVPQITA